jgi:hypothetical protein
MDPTAHMRIRTKNLRTNFAGLTMASNLAQSTATEPEINRHFNYQWILQSQRSVISGCRFHLLQLQWLQVSTNLSAKQCGRLKLCSVQVDNVTDEEIMDYKYNKWCLAVTLLRLLILPADLF